MNLKLNEIEINNLVRLDGPQRYQYFVKRVADTGQIWGLYKDGWALVNDDTGQQYVPLWPAPEYANLCANNQWASYEAEPIEIHQFINEYLDELEKNSVGLAIFYVPNDLGVTPTYQQLSEDLERELSRIE